VSAEPTPSQTFGATAVAVATVLIAGRLFVPAAVLAFSSHASEQFRETGLPPWVRLTLALPEMIGALLFAFPRTFYLGTVLLIVVLLGAIGAHLYLHIQPIGLYVLLAAVLALAALKRLWLKS
jgi:hypothetical protein